jgi:hypothetical protein
VETERKRNLDILKSLMSMSGTGRIAALIIIMCDILKLLID